VITSLNSINRMRFHILTAASMKFRFVFWDVDNCFTRQYIPEVNLKNIIQLIFVMETCVCFDRLIYGSDELKLQDHWDRLLDIIHDQCQYLSYRNTYVLWHLQFHCVSEDTFYKKA
jgi:hypothetical protein